MLRQLAQQRMTLSDLEWPFHASHTISAVAELVLVIICIYVGAVSYHCNVTWTQGPCKCCTMDQTGRWQYVVTLMFFDIYRVFKIIND